MPTKDCAKFKKVLKVDTRIEMCAGYKIFRKIDAYRRHGKTFKRLPKKRKRDYEVRYGRTDTCAGDSGAMLPDIVEKILFNKVQNYQEFISKNSVNFSEF